MLTEYLVKKIITCCMRNHAEYFITEAPKSIRGKFMESGGRSCIYKRIPGREVLKGQRRGLHSE